MPVKVAVVAQAKPELDAIRHRLKNPAKFMVREFLSLDEVKSGLDAFAFEVLLMRLGAFRMQNVPMLMKVHSRFPQASFVALANEIEPSARFQIRAMPRTKLLHESTEVDDLSLIVEKLARGDVSSPRLHARVKREGEAELVNPKLGYRLKAKFLDFAQMGARVWVQAKNPLQKNDRLQLHYPSSSEPGKIHRIEALVVWQQITSGMMDTIVKGPQQIVGVRFIVAL